MQNKTRPMIEAALMGSLTSVFAMMGTYIPILSFFILLLIPIPFMILGKRHGIKYSILSIVASVIITGSLIGPIYSIFIIMLPGITAVVMGYMMNKEYPPSHVLLGGAAAALISSLISIQLGSILSGVNITTQVGQMFNELISIQTQLYKNMGMEKEKIEYMKNTLEATGKLSMMIIPAAILFSSAFLAYINYILTVHVLNRMGYKIEGLPPITHFQLPKSILMGTFLIIGLTMITKYFNIVHYETLVLNVFIIFLLIYLIQGWAVLSYFIKAFKIGIFSRTMIILLILFNQIFIFLIAIIGFIDTYFDFRKIQGNG